MTLPIDSVRSERSRNKRGFLRDKNPCLFISGILLAPSLGARKPQRGRCAFLNSISASASLASFLMLLRRGTLSLALSR